MRGHIIVSGDDALAMQIVDELNDAEISVVPLKSPKALESADVAGAHAVIAASPDDALNLEVALLARKANPKVRVVARIGNTTLRAAMDDPGDPGDILDVADLAAPSVVEALLGRTAHTIHVGNVDFVVSGATATTDGTLREIYGRLAPVAIIRGDNSPDAGEVIACPSLDTEVRAGDWTSMIGRPEELAAQGMKAGRTGDITAPRRPALWRVLDSVRAFSDDIHPTFYRALGVLGTLLVGSTIILRFFYHAPGMGWMDALYFSTETLATVGYGDFNFMNQPLWLRLWGVVMMLGGLATTAIVVAFVADVLLSRRLSQATSRQHVRHMRRHFVVVGLGSFGIQVASMLKEAGYSVVVIERDENNPYLPMANEQRIAVIVGDATQRNTLEAARVEHCRAIAVLTDRDMVNIEIGIVLREIIGSDQTPHGQRIPIVMRIFDRDLGDAVGQRLGFQYVRSTVDLATPWFIGAAMGLEVLGTFSVGQRSFMVGGVQVQRGSALDGVRMFELSTQTRVIAMERDGMDEMLHPHHDVRLEAGDIAYLVGPYHELLETLRKGQLPD
ncbi:MAG TPA: NAD-binding protein [Mycobacterium sp.]|uniref:NAD-binding protein n=1 Tax=Mycolicibacterium sp. TaxID=2320850 RepID=UPI002601255A|nr:NAD-binding protein [Mycolicibacterium sp.]HPX35786.1 NAD-binding protein [Mycobacterium sp.]HQC76519.1 NAD-binding protein [Mycobacterium sp.]